MTHITHVRNLKMAESGRSRIKCRVPEAGLEERGFLVIFLLQIDIMTKAAYRRKS